jgi:hypothetical protein
MATAADLVKRRFARPAPDQLWVADITEHPRREGKLYCCVVLVCSPVGWWAGRSTATRPTWRSSITGNDATAPWVGAPPLKFEKLNTTDVA